MNKLNQSSVENNSQSGQDKSKDADKKKDAPFKICGPIQDPVGDALRVLDFAKVRSSSEIKEIREGSGFTALSFKGRISKGSFFLDQIYIMIPNLFKILNFPQKQEIINTIYGQAWIDQCQEGDSLFIYHGGSGQQMNIGIELTPKDVEFRKAIRYRMGTLETTFTLASPIMIIKKTRKSIFREKTTEEMVNLPPKLGIQQMKGLNEMQNFFVNSMIQGVNMKRILQNRDDEDEFNQGDPYKQLKN